MKETKIMFRFLRWPSEKMMLPCFEIGKNGEGSGLLKEFGLDTKQCI